MGSGSGQRAALAATLALCGAALLFLLVHRQSELAAALSPVPAIAPLASRALSTRARVDVETWAEAVGSIVLLLGAGALLHMASGAQRGPSTSLDAAGATDLERRLREARANEASTRLELALARSSADKTRALLVDHQERSEREIDTLGLRIHSLIAELAPQRRPSPPPPPPREPEPVIASPSARSEVPLRSVSLPPPSNGRPSDPPRSWNAEHRRDTRFSAQVEVDIQSDSHFYTGLSENLSEGGLFVATYVPRPVGTEVDLSLKLPGLAAPVRTKGIVRWIREYSDLSDSIPGMGLRLYLDDADLPHVRRFLDSRPPLFFDDG